MKEPRIKHVDGKVFWRCSRCKEHKPDEDYHMIKKFKKTGPAYFVPFVRCKACQIEYQRERRARLAGDLFGA